jgi:hypothetical protein
LNDKEIAISKISLRAHTGRLNPIKNHPRVIIFTDDFAKQPQRGQKNQIKVRVKMLNFCILLTKSMKNVTQNEHVFGVY